MILLPIGLIMVSVATAIALALIEDAKDGVKAVMVGMGYWNSICHMEYCYYYILLCFK